MNGIVPVTEDPDTAGFFAAAREGRLVAQSCSACGRMQQPPRPRCVNCLSAELTWKDLPPRGSIYSWTVVEHQINPNFPAPYTVILVEVDPGIENPPLRFMGRIQGREELQIGNEVELVFDKVGDAVLPNWRIRRG